MKAILLICLMLAGLAGYAQQTDTTQVKKYDYIILYHVVPQTITYFSSSENKEFVEHLKELKIKNIIDCVKLLEDKGWELVNFNFNQESLVLTHEAYLRKRRFK